MKLKNVLVTTNNCTLGWAIQKDLMNYTLLNIKRRFIIWVIVSKPQKRGAEDIIICNEESIIKEKGKKRIKGYMPVLPI